MQMILFGFLLSTSLLAPEVQLALRKSEGELFSLLVSWQHPYKHTKET